MNNHLETIEIKNFKCFKDFKAQGLKRVNLIGGKNNVGKTAFMEACYINLEKNPSIALMEIIEGRYMADFFGELAKEVGIKYILNIIQKKATIFNNAKIVSNFKTIKINYNENDIKEEKSENIIFLDSYRTSSKSLDTLYSIVLENKLENKIDEALKLFDENIDSFRIINSEPKCSLLIDNKFYNLNEFGDGLYRYLTYLCIFYGIKNGIVFIDEIDNGIHYTKFDRLWEIILTLSKEQNVQVFATTHSKECIESYARVAKKLEDEDISFVELGKNKNNELKAMTFPYKWFIDEVEQNHEVRGW